MIFSFDKKFFQGFWIQSKLSGLILFAILAGAIFFASCANSGNKENTNSAGSGVPENSVTALVAKDLEGELVKSGMLEVKAKVIKDGALKETNGILTDYDDILKAAPLLARGAMKGTANSDLDDSQKIAAIKIIAASLIKSLKDRVSGLTNAAIEELILSIVRELAGSLDKTGLNTSTDIINGLKAISSGATGSLGNTGFSDSLKAGAIEKISFGAVDGLGEIKGNVAGLNEKLPEAVSSIVQGSIGSLDEIGLSQTQIAYCAKLVVAGSTKALDDAGITESTVITSILKSATTTAVGSLDEAGLEAIYISKASMGIMDMTYNSLTEAGVADKTLFLSDIKDAAALGFDGIDANLVTGTFDLPVAKSSATNYSGEYMDPYAASMGQTSNANMDTTSPAVITVFPANGTVDQAITSTVAVSFSEEMDKASAESSFSVKQGTTAVSGTIQWSGNTLTFTPGTALSYSTAYSVSVAISAKDLAGNSLSVAFSSSFNTGAMPDTQAPGITAGTPSGNNKSITSVVTITFSEGMTKSSVEGSFSLINGTSDVMGSFNWSGNVMTFTPSSNLAYSTTYSIKATTDAKDLAGNALAAQYSSIFTTGAMPDTLAPSVTGATPSGSNKPITSVVSVTFSEAMNQASAESSFSLNNGTSDVLGSFGWSVNQMTFTPNNPLSYSVTYTIKVTTSARDSAANPLAAQFTSTFSTEGPPQGTIHVRTSVDGTLDITPGQEVGVTISGPPNYNLTTASGSVDQVTSSGAYDVTCGSVTGYNVSGSETNLTLNPGGSVDVVCAYTVQCVQYIEFESLSDLNGAVANAENSGLLLKNDSVCSSAQTISGTYGGNGGWNDSFYFNTGSATKLTINYTTNCGCYVYESLSIYKKSDGSIIETLMIDRSGFNGTFSYPFTNPLSQNSDIVIRIEDQGFGSGHNYVLEFVDATP